MNAPPPDGVWECRTISRWSGGTLSAQAASWKQQSHGAAGGAWRGWSFVPWGLGQARIDGAILLRRIHVSPWRSRRGPPRRSLERPAPALPCPADQQDLRTPAFRLQAHPGCELRRVLNERKAHLCGAWPRASDIRRVEPRLQTISDSFERASTAHAERPAMDANVLAPIDERASAGRVPNLRGASPAPECLRG